MKINRIYFYQIQINTQQDDTSHSRPSFMLSQSGPKTIYSEASKKIANLQTKLALLEKFAKLQKKIEFLNCFIVYSFFCHKYKSS
jgi:hypothetical protein